MNQELTLKTQQRLAVIGRMRMAEWIEMPEEKFAQEVRRLENDPLFKKLFLGSANAPGVIRRQKWPRARLASGYRELREGLLSSMESVPVEKMLQGKGALIAGIRRMGEEDFERYFLYPEEAFSLEEIAQKTGLKVREILAIHELVAEVDVNGNFNPLGRDASSVRGYSCLGRIALDDGDPYIEFTASYWGRGLYQIRYDQLERWKRGGLLSGFERRELRRMVKNIETINLRQNTIYRVLESLAQLQAHYLKSQDEITLRPISLRLLARHLNLAPSTLSRAAAGRSIRLPWGHEIPLIRLMPGQRKILKTILSQWIHKDGAGTDKEWAEKLLKNHGIAVSRRTVNAVRHCLN